MKSIFGWRSAMTVVLLAAATIPVTWAQEEAPVEETGNRLGNLYFDFEAWVAQPVGLDYTPASYVDQSSGFNATPLTIQHGTTDENRWGLEYALPQNWGNVSFSLYRHDDDERMSAFQPSDFVFGELLTYPYLAGVNNDGLADAFISQTATRLRDWSIEFSRDAFRTPRVVAEWSLGWRRVEHKRALYADYYALVPGFPVLLPPGPFCEVDPPDVCRLEPLPDRASIGSNFEGRGITAGLDLEFPMWQNKLVLEGGVTISAMRGKTDTFYGAKNHYYLLDFDDEVSILGPPYDEFEQIVPNPSNPSQMVPLLSFISQLDYSVALSSSGVSTSASVIETELGLRWRTPLEWLEVYAGMRQTYYDNVGIDLRPKNLVQTVTEDGMVILNGNDVDRVERSVTYEGFYGGVRIRLF